MDNCGIYALWWEEPELVYVGQSGNLLSRKADHLRKLRYGTHVNYLMQRAFNMYGEPAFIVLEHSNLSSLNKLEQKWIIELSSFDSEKGLNLSPGEDKREPFLSTFSKIQIYKAFICIYKYRNTRKQASSRSGVSIYAIKDMVQGRKYLWLKEKYPDKWEAMRSTGRLNMADNWKFQPIHNTTTCISLKSPSGEEVPVLSKYTDICAKYPELTPTGISRLIHNRARTFRGWTLCVKP